MTSVRRFPRGRVRIRAGKRSAVPRAKRAVWTALTGTPGSGKSAIGRRLRGEWEVVEVRTLSRRWGCFRAGRDRTLEVDLDCVARKMRTFGPRSISGGPVPPTVLTGHLAHLLPVRDVIVLRCHPRRLEQRLRPRRLRAAELFANLTSEATDLVLIEAAARPRRGRIWEIDTSERSPANVARQVKRLLHYRPPSSYGRVDWLSDPWVTEELLRRAR